MNISLCKMTEVLYREYRKEFCYDADIFLDSQKIPEYRYSEADADAYVARQRALGRDAFVIMAANIPVGELYLKNIDPERGTCALGIHMKNDSCKNKGYGTAAQILALEYAFHERKLHTVFADSLHKNKRSQHVLQKVGFRYTHSDEVFHYYRCDKADWIPPMHLQEKL